ncbi:MAG: protein kinase, partial [Planctomycetes bacterium]|nr:protein kinase [Planctomycetota bacterium]
MALVKGTKLGPYEILSPLGAGGMGEVYRAKDTKLHREVAIKVLPADLASSPERLQRFEREAKTVAALNHPNIVTIFGIEESGGHRFIAMELVEGETLDRMIAPGGMPLAKIFDIAIPLSDALAAAHDKGIVHRDLKPANVMVTKEGRVKVLDFGLAKLTAAGQGGSSPDDVTMSAPLTRKGMIIGTVPYMSPEQLKSDPLDHRTDLFSLGIMLYEMATGQRPFKGHKSAEMMSSILRDTPRPLHELNGVLPRHLGRIIEHCLEKNAEERFQSAKDVRNELRALQKEVDSGSELSESQPVSIQTVVSPPPSSTSSASVSGSSMSAPAKRGELWIGVGVLAVVIALAAWWLGRDVDAPGRTAVTSASSEITPSTPDKPGASQESQQRPGIRTTLAILPFENISTDPDTEYLSNEIPANIIDKLSGLSSLSVISRSGAFRFDPAKEDASSFGKTLGASVVLTGQLNARDTSLTIRIELVDVATNRQLWSKRYSRELSDIMAVEEDITQNISEALRLQLTPEEKTKFAKDDTKNPDAYRSYLQGRFWWNKRSAEGFAKALEHFQKAIDHDPEYALAYAGLADTHILLAMFELVLPNEAFREARRAAQAALRIDEMLAEAHVSLGAVQCFFDWDMDSAQKSFERAIELNPAYPTAYHWYAFVFLARGDLPGAIEALEQAHDLDPLAPIISSELACFLRLDRRYPEAERLFRQVLELDPLFARAHQELGVLLLEVGQSKEGLAELETANQLASSSSFYAGILGAAYAQVGRTSDARKLLSDLQERSRTEYMSPVALAAIHAGLGETNEALVRMEQALSGRDPAFLLVHGYPSLERMLGEPRMAELLRRGGYKPVREPPVLIRPEPRKLMLAVLPFANLSGDPEQEYFSDGMTEEMITRLGRLRPELLGVIARTSAMRYKNTRKTIAEIGHELGVAYVVEGGVRRSGNSVRISAQLIQVSDQTQIWGDSYTRD